MRIDRKNANYCDKSVGTGWFIRFLDIFRIQFVRHKCLAILIGRQIEWRVCTVRYESWTVANDAINRTDPFVSLSWVVRRLRKHAASTVNCGKFRLVSHARALEMNYDLSHANWPLIFHNLHRWPDSVGRVWGLRCGQFSSAQGFHCFWLRMRAFDSEKQISDFVVGCRCDYF